MLQLSPSPSLSLAFQASIEQFREFPSGRPFYGERPAGGAALGNANAASTASPTQWAKPRSLCLHQWKTLSGYLNVDVNLVREVSVLFDTADRSVEASWGGWATLNKLVQNVLANPEDAKFRRLKHGKSSQIKSNRTERTCFFFLLCDRLLLCMRCYFSRASLNSVPLFVSRA